MPPPLTIRFPNMCPLCGEDESHHRHDGSQPDQIFCTQLQQEQHQQPRNRHSSSLLASSSLIHPAAVEMVKTSPHQPRLLASVSPQHEYPLQHPQGSPAIQSSPTAPSPTTAPHSPVKTPLVAAARAMWDEDKKPAVHHPIKDDEDDAAAGAVVMVPTSLPHAGGDCPLPPEGEKGRFECEVCGCDCDAATPHICCSQGTHYVCRDCFSNYVETTWADRTKANISGLTSEPQVPCVTPGCQSAPFTRRFVVQNTTESAGTVFWTMLDNVKDVATLAKAQGLAIQHQQQQQQLINNTATTAGGGGLTAAVTQRAVEQTNQALLEAQLQAEHKAGARMLMCPRCHCGPVFHEDCNDLGDNHGSGGVNNACRNCGFFSSDAARWSQWDDVLRTQGSMALTFWARLHMYAMAVWLPVCWILIIATLALPWVTVGCLEAGLFELVSSCTGGTPPPPTWAEDLQNHLQAARVFGILTLVCWSITAFCFFMQEGLGFFKCCTMHYTLTGILGIISWILMTITWTIITGFMDHQDPPRGSGTELACYSSGFVMFVVSWVVTTLVISFWAFRALFVCC